MQRSRPPICLIVTVVILSMALTFLNGKCYLLGCFWVIEATKDTSFFFILLFIYLLIDWYFFVYSFIYLFVYFFNWLNVKQFGQHPILSKESTIRLLQIGALDLQYIHKRFSLGRSPLCICLYRLLWLVQCVSGCYPSCITYTSVLMSFSASFGTFQWQQ